MKENQLFASQLRRGDLIDVPAGQLPNPPYLRAAVRSIRFDDGEAVVRTDDGGEQRYKASSLVTVYSE